MRAHLGPVIVACAVLGTACADSSTTPSGAEQPATPASSSPATTVLESEQPTSEATSAETLRLCDLVSRLTYSDTATGGGSEMADLTTTDLPEDLEAAIEVVSEHRSQTTRSAYQTEPVTTGSQVGDDDLAKAKDAVAAWRDRNCGALD